MINVLQELYNSEINFEISTFWDGGFDWKLGDGMNGFKAVGNESSMEEAITGVAIAAMQYYPQSVFVMSFKSELLKMKLSLGGRPGGIAEGLRS